MNKATFDKTLADYAAQLLHECNDWIQRLNLIKEESCGLKTKLSEAVDVNTDIEFLNNAEYFQSLIINQEEFIKTILKDIRVQTALIRNIIQTGQLKEELLPKGMQVGLKKRIIFAENQFSNLKSQFISTMIL